MSSATASSTAPRPQSVLQHTFDIPGATRTGSLDPDDPPARMSAHRSQRPVAADRPDTFLGLASDLALSHPEPVSETQTPRAMGCATAARVGGSVPEWHADERLQSRKRDVEVVDC